MVKKETTEKSTEKRPVKLTVEQRLEAIEKDIEEMSLRPQDLNINKLKNGK